VSDKPRWFQTTAIDYPNSRPHIGTAFEKLGADVQARYRRMEGYDVFYLMGTDENTLKVRKGRSWTRPAGILHDMAASFCVGERSTFFDIFIQQAAAHQCCRRSFRVHDNGHIRGDYEGWYSNGCEDRATRSTGE
jgi:methionyl-tRNA synthetase